MPLVISSSIVQRFEHFYVIALRKLNIIIMTIHFINYIKTSTISFCGLGSKVRVEVLGSVNSNRNHNPKHIYNPNPNPTLTLILTLTINLT